MTTTTQGRIFNVDEPQGADKVQFETTAAAAQAEAPTSSIARQVERNADQVQDAAHDVAKAAQEKGTALTGEGPSALDRLHADARQVTNDAVSEGKRDVNRAVEQAQEFASNTGTVDSAQSYLKQPSGGQATSTLSNAASQLQATAVAAADTTKEYLASAQQAAQPHIDRAKEIASSYLGGSNSKEDDLTPASSTGIPAAKKA